MKNVSEINKLMFAGWVFLFEIGGDQSARTQPFNMWLESAEIFLEYKWLDEMGQISDLTQFVLVVWAKEKNVMFFNASYKAKAQYHELKEIHNPENIEDYEPSALNARIMY
jgi:hypothetical protein